MKPYLLTLLIGLIIALTDLLGRSGRQSNSSTPALAKAIANVRRLRATRNSQ